MKITWAKLLIAIVAVLVITIAFGLTQVTIQNSSTIVAGRNIFLTQPSTTNPNSCPADGDAAYTQGLASVAWTLTAGAGGQQQYFCIDNQGTASDIPSVTSSLASGTCPSNGNSLIFAAPSGVPSSLAPHTATSSPVVITVCAGSLMAATGIGPTFTVTVT